MIQIFVYGTLKPGESNYSECAAWVISARPAIAHGQLYHLPFGYPAMVLGDGITQGFLLQCRDRSVLDHLDAYETHDPSDPVWNQLGQSCANNEYQRVAIPVWSTQGSPLGMGWAYVMTADQVQRLQGQRLLGHCWSDRSGGHSVNAPSIGH